MPVDVLLTALAAFLVTIDPLGVTAVFVALTADLSARQRRGVAVRAVLIATAILALFAFVGRDVLTVVGIDLPAFRIAGGILLLLIALEMLFEKRNVRRDDTATKLHSEMPGQDLAVFPIAMPLLAGPGAITAVMLLTAQNADVPGGFWAVILGLVATLTASLIMLVFAAGAATRMSKTVTDIVSRLLGMVLAALAVQYVIDGIKEAFVLAG